MLYHMTLKTAYLLFDDVSHLNVISIKKGTLVIFIAVFLVTCLNKCLKSTNDDHIPHNYHSANQEDCYHKE